MYYTNIFCKLVVAVSHVTKLEDLPSFDFPKPTWVLNFSEKRLKNMISGKYKHVFFWTKEQEVLQMHIL